MSLLEQATGRRAEVVGDGPAVERGKGIGAGRGRASGRGHEDLDRNRLRDRRGDRDRDRDRFTDRDRGRGLSRDDRLNDRRMRDTVTDRGFDPVGDRLGSGRDIGRRRFDDVELDGRGRLRDRRDEVHNLLEGLREQDFRDRRRRREPDLEPSDRLLGVSNRERGGYDRLTDNRDRLDAKYDRLDAKYHYDRNTDRVRTVSDAGGGDNTTCMKMVGIPYTAHNDEITQFFQGMCE